MPLIVQQGLQPLLSTPEEKVARTSLTMLLTRQWMSRANSSEECPACKATEEVVAKKGGSFNR